jgi:hypothetical protein
MAPYLTAGLSLLMYALDCVSAHNSLIIPSPRNAADGAKGVYPGSAEGRAPPGGLTCTCADSAACDMGDARKVGGAGQGCLWWSQGCSIGCDYCAQYRVAAMLSVSCQLLLQLVAPAGATTA